MSKNFNWYEITIAEVDDPIGGGEEWKKGFHTTPKVIGFRALFERPDDDYEVVDGVTAEGHMTHTQVIEHCEDFGEFIDLTDQFDHGTWLMPSDGMGNERKGRGWE